MDGSLTRWFQMTVGNRQGDPISPNTFLTFLERIIDEINETEDKGVIVQGLSVSIYNLKFADDVDKDPDNLQLMLNKLCEGSEKYGMCIKKDKTKSMTFRRSVQSDEITLSIHGTQEEYVHNFIYLESMISCNNDCTLDIIIRRSGQQ